MAIDHEAHKIRIKAVSDRMNHPMTYNDAGAPKQDFVKPDMNRLRDVRGQTDRERLVGKR
jgi:hypothetical protein